MSNELVRDRRLTAWLAIAAVLVAALLVARPGDANATRATGTTPRTYRISDGAAPGWVRTAAERAARQLDARGATLRLEGADADRLGMVHVRFDQFHRGVAVFGGQVIAHLDGSGTLQSQSGRTYRIGRLRVRPEIGPELAIETARGVLGFSGAFDRRTADLVVFPSAGSPILAWWVRLWIENGSEATAHHEYFVDASSGRIAWSYDSLPTDSLVVSSALGTGASLYSGTVSMETVTDGSRFGLGDLTRGSMRVFDLGNAMFGRGRVIFDQDNAWGNGTTSDRVTVAVDAHFGAQMTWDYYLNRFGRRGIDGNGYTMVSRVHYGTNYANAFWDGSKMSYGDGDGVEFGPLVSLDVVGHEITHGLTERTAGLIYSGEPGAINESFSDVFGTAVEFYVGNRPGRAVDYFIGEDFTIPADTAPGFRNMANPLEDGDPDNYTIRDYPNCTAPTLLNDNCGVHSNSGIMNNAFYLLAEGGVNSTSGLSVTGIGRANAEAIFYRALTVYLFPSANFRDARRATVHAADDLFGVESPQSVRTASAWTAVGVP